MKKTLKKLSFKKNIISSLQVDSITGAGTAPVSRCNCPPQATNTCTDKSKCCKQV